MAKDKKDGPVYTQPTTELDLEARLAAERGEQAPSVGEARKFQVEGNDTSAYVGVSPEYQGYADDTHKPFKAEGGVNKEVEEKLLADDVAVQTQPSTIVDGAPNPGVGAPPVQTSSDDDEGAKTSSKGESKSTPKD